MIEVLEPSLAKISEALGIKRLNEVQRIAADSGLYTTDGDFGIVSMSRTGKSFAGGLLIANELFQAISKRKEETPDSESNELAIILAPFHASARDTSATLSQFFGWFLRPMVVVGEIRENRSILQLSKGFSPNVLIATPDAMFDMIRMQETREWLLSRNLRVLVSDDTHSIIHDPVRGPMLFEIMKFAKNQMTPSPRILILSAQFDEPTRLETAFGVKLIIDEKEYDPPDIRLINYKSTKEKHTKFAEHLLDLADDGTRTLVYVNSIDQINNFVEEKGSELGEAVSFDVEHIIRERLEKVSAVLKELEYPSYTQVEQGIGCYHGQMDEAQRWFIEWAFRRKYIRFLFGTEALAYGVNTPVSHVVMSAPGIDEIFRQSMMARAVRMRRGKGRAGDCTVFTKSITDVGELQRVYSSPKLPTRFLNNSQLSKILLGQIGLGLMKTESERKKLSKRLGMFYKKSSTSRVLKQMIKMNRPLVEKKDNEFHLTPLGEVAFENNLSHEQIVRFFEGLSIITENGSEPTEFDILLLLNHVALLERGRIARKKELDDELQQFYEEKIDSVLAKGILDNTLEPVWKQAIEYSTLVYVNQEESLTYESKSRKSIDRLKMEMEMFEPNFRDFLLSLETNETILSEDERKTVQNILKVIQGNKFIGMITSVTDSMKHSLKGRDLSFVDFSDIERTIDLTLESDLSAIQKIKLLDLFDTVESTTRAFVDLMERSVDDPQAKEALDLVCGFATEGQVGSNLIKALEEEGVLERGTTRELWHSFSTRVKDLKKKTSTPAKAANVLLSLFTGDVVGAATGGVDVLRAVFGRVKGDVDTSGIS
ncbi:MAG: DEAD/DEAH box helicase [Candidatus Lokiarchaeota archaeon]|nr:DEAD/DEAH box helicase [Candidatus Lokiarchaeota archaeon]